LRRPTERSEINLKKPNPELIDDENPEWTEEDFAKAVPFSGLPLEMQKLLSGEKRVKPDVEASSTRQPAA
jgi:hypothetical protein